MAVSRIAEIFDKAKRDLDFETSRSSGKGGQHVNKTETKVTLVWNVEKSILGEEIFLKFKKIKHHYIDYPFIRISSQKTRSQLKNKADALNKLAIFLEEFLREEKERKKTKIPKSAKTKRLDDKKERSNKKSTRKKIDPNDF